MSQTKVDIKRKTVWVISLCCVDLSAAIPVIRLGVSSLPPGSSHQEKSFLMRTQSKDLNSDALTSQSRKQCCFKVSRGLTASTTSGVWKSYPNAFIPILTEQNKRSQGRNTTNLTLGLKKLFISITLVTLNIQNEKRVSFEF